MRKEEKKQLQMATTMFSCVYKQQKYNKFNTKREQKYEKIYRNYQIAKNINSTKQMGDCLKKTVITDDGQRLSCCTQVNKVRD